MSDQHILAKLLTTTTHKHIKRDSAQPLQLFLNLRRQSQGDQTRSWFFDPQTKLPCDAITKAGRSQRGNGQPSGGYNY